MGSQRTVLADGGRMLCICRTSSVLCLTYATFSLPLDMVVISFWTHPLSILKLNVLRSSFSS